MPQANAATFIEALGRLESDGDTDTIAGLFAPGASIANPVVAHDGEGEQGARRFWQGYREAFGNIRSTFSHTLEQDGVAILEWTSTGDAHGRAVDYPGVSVLEFGANGITAFRTYFDPARLGRQLVGEEGAKAGRATR